MNKHIKLHNDALVCGTITGHDCICLREPGHWGIHMFRGEAGEYRVLQVGFYQISFEIPEPIAKIAMKDKDWTWSE